MRPPESKHVASFCAEFDVMAAHQTLNFPDMIPALELPCEPIAVLIDEDEYCDHLACVNVSVFCPAPLYVVGW